MKKRASELVCVVKDTVCTRGVKCEKERVKEFGINEMWDTERNRCVELNVCRYVFFGGEDFRRKFALM